MSHDASHSGPSDLTWEETQRRTISNLRHVLDQWMKKHDDQSELVRVGVEEIERLRADNQRLTDENEALRGWRDAARTQRDRALEELDQYARIERMDEPVEQEAS